MPPTLRLNGLVKGVENDVGEQRGDDATLWSSLHWDADDAILTDTGGEEALKEADDAAVRDFSASLGHHNPVVKPVEEGGNVRVNDVAEAVLPVQDCGCDGVVSFTAWPESVASFRESRFEDGRQDLIDRLLTDAIGYSGDSHVELHMTPAHLGKRWR